jgi:F-type H+-transporting ATPase subunit epsilon
MSDQRTNPQSHFDELLKNKDKMYLEIVTPEKKLLQAEISAVQLPGTDGLFQLLKNHAPIVATLKKGVIKANLKDSTQTLDNLSGDIILDTSDDKTVKVEINGGVVEMMNNNVIVLAD